MDSVSNEHILGQTYRGYNVQPLAKLHYGKFPYRVVLNFTPDADLEERYKQVMTDMLGEEVNLIAHDLGMAGAAMVRTRLRRTERVITKSLGDIDYRKSARLGEKWGTDDYSGDLKFFLPTQDALDIVLDYAGGKNVKEVEALHDEAHLELIKDPRFTTQRRDSPWHGIFDYKVDISSNKRDRDISLKEMAEYYTVIKDFLKSQADPNEYTIRKNWKRVTVFANQDLILEVLPMLRFEIKMGKYDVVRALVG
jgi:hypothetical protein